MKTAVITFGRFNPPTVGHSKLVDKVRSVARLEKGEPMVYLSHSNDKKKNPLNYSDKIKIAQKSFGTIVKRTSSSTIIKILQELEGKYDRLIMVVGSDRVQGMRKLLNDYNGKDYDFAEIIVVSAGARDPDAEGVEGMSASKMRQAVLDDNRAGFESGLPDKVKKDSNKIFDMIAKVIRK
ncbi:MAG: hypothetical protein N0C84_00415 [Candidatus Thiodiazotropha taylori]|uniref:Cytidyltransferase-like domain-containing protein n=1 Tax=Candidatus Thiodiazotropha taylori TaxID=2792791 RepID=A0A9E4K9X7_9GAMM|nr:hypothetical protein [Candidatus Thiodiazotropha taylori]MCW4254907.1 hypothetical protein [Candidatus Thiodiazotropha taylori]